jgi:hypothetical protein
MGEAAVAESLLDPPRGREEPAHKGIGFIDFGEHCAQGRKKESRRGRWLAKDGGKEEKSGGS